MAVEPDEGAEVGCGRRTGRGCRAGLRCSGGALAAGLLIVEAAEGDLSLLDSPRPAPSDSARHDREGDVNGAAVPQAESSWVSTTYFVSARESSCLIRGVRLAGRSPVVGGERNVGGWQSVRTFLDAVLLQVLSLGGR